MRRALSGSHSTCGRRLWPICIVSLWFVVASAFAHGDVGVSSPDATAAAETAAPLVAEDSPRVAVQSLGRGLTWLTRSVLGRAFSRTAATWDNILLERLRAPMTLGWSLACAGMLLPAFGLYQPAHQFVLATLGAIGAVVLFWGLWRSVDVGGAALASSAWVVESAVGALDAVGRGAAPARSLFSSPA